MGDSTAGPGRTTLSLDMGASDPAVGVAPPGLTCPAGGGELPGHDQLRDDNLSEGRHQQLVGLPGIGQPPADPLRGHDPARGALGGPARGGRDPRTNPMTYDVQTTL